MRKPGNYTMHSTKNDRTGMTFNVAGVFYWGEWFNEAECYHLLLNSPKEARKLAKKLNEWAEWKENNEASA